MKQTYQLFSIIAKRDNNDHKHNVYTIHINNQLIMCIHINVDYIDLRNTGTVPITVHDLTVIIKMITVLREEYLQDEIQKLRESKD